MGARSRGLAAQVALIVGVAAAFGGWGCAPGRSSPAGTAAPAPLPLPVASVDTAAGVLEAADRLAWIALQA
jgi:hypothetical protein